jgi:putative membrane protein insertion efficiency factor
MIKLMKTLLLLMVCSFLAIADTAPAHDSDPSENGSNQEMSIFLFPISFYQKIISPAVGNRCRMRPSCSNYSKEAFQDYGFFLGWIMTCDRLMRCGRDEADLSPKVWTPEGRLILDPLSANTVFDPPSAQSDID